jgi:hypothetical protein
MPGRACARPVNVRGVPLQEEAGQEATLQPAAAFLRPGGFVRRRSRAARPWRSWRSCTAGWGDGRARQRTIRRGCVLPARRGLDFCLLALCTALVPRLCTGSGVRCTLPCKMAILPSEAAASPFTDSHLPCLWDHRFVGAGLVAFASYVVTAPCNPRRPAPAAAAAAQRPPARPPPGDVAIIGVCAASLPDAVRQHGARPTV